MKGDCIGQGSYQELAKSGFDFMALLIEEEDYDSAIESESDEPGVKRSFSRLQSQHGFSLGRSDSVQSRSSHRTSFMLESQLSIMTSETEVSIFVSFVWMNCYLLINPRTHFSATVNLIFLKGREYPS